MTVVSADHVNVELGGRLLIADLSFRLDSGDTVGIVGPNGCGKTTLLRAMSGQFPIIDGSLSVRGTVGIVHQDAAPLHSVRRHVEQQTGVAAAARELDRAAHAIASGSDDPGVADRYDTALQRWLGLGGADLWDRFAQIAAGLGLVVTPESSSLSGGERTLLDLACVLLSRYDLLLLDEPTNNLDPPARGHLLRFLGTCSSAVALVSHDRDLLDAVVGAVIEFDPVLAETKFYPGSFTDWRRERARNREHQQQRYDAAQRRRLDLETAAREAERRSRRGAGTADRKYRQGRVDKLGRNAMREGATAGASRASRLRRELARQSPVEGPRRQWQLHFRFGEPIAGAAPLSITGVRRATVEFELRADRLQAGKGDRILLVGNNGSGKSTLLGLVAERLEADSGQIERPAFGYLDQRRTLPEGPLLGSVRRLAPSVDEQDLRSQLAKFGLDSAALGAPVSACSPGQRTRALLASLCVRHLPLLLLDEPTNHLDLAGCDALDEALAEYTGTVLLATHDPALARAFAPTHVWEFSEGIVLATAPDP
ncbi:MAG: ABC-F family ATP-binding cassette domain-containing protein [Actinobacteria bacterium]|nr:ABC-F family ATP-binding cassette domain-containing protein [Actinomycetota bacterium]